MAFEVIWSNRAKKDLSYLQREIVIHILKKVEMARVNPYRLLHKLVGERAWRLRAGDYRIFCDIDNTRDRIEIIQIRHRKNAYKRL